LESGPFRVLRGQANAIGERAEALQDKLEEFMNYISTNLAAIPNYADRDRHGEPVDWNTKLLVAMMRYQIELDLSFLPEPVTDEERKIVTEKGARRFDRFEQWLMRHLVDPESLYSRLQDRITPTDEDFEKSP
jgi:hypothetical protein